jgi:hypothetical protein
MAAAPLAAQSSNGPWWDPGRAQTRSGQNGSVYGRDGNVYSQQADGVWRADSRDRNGNTIYVRTRYDSNGQLVREWATRNIIGRYNIIDRQYLNDGNGTYGNNRGVYDTRNGTYDRRAQEEQMKRQEKLRREQLKREEKYRKEELKREREYQKQQDKVYRDQQRNNDRWYDNNGHDNGKHKGRGKDKDHDGDRH